MKKYFVTEHSEHIWSHNTQHYYIRTRMTILYCLDDVDLYTKIRGLEMSDVERKMCNNVWVLLWKTCLIVHREFLISARYFAILEKRNYSIIVDEFERTMRTCELMTLLDWMRSNKNLSLPYIIRLLKQSFFRLANEELDTKLKRLEDADRQRELNICFFAFHITIWLMEDSLVQR